MAEETRFEFGRNWSRYIEKSFSQERVEISKRKLLSYLGLSDLEGRSFIDIGCGSGLHSLAAHQSGAGPMHSFDYDPDSVKTTDYLRREKAGDPANWKVERGSVLDENYMRSLGHFDIVYSWGVLHHTGDLWSALRLAALPVKPGGLFYIALYSLDAEINPSAEFWLETKQRYVGSTEFMKTMMVLWYVWRFQMQKRLRELPNTVRTILDYRAKRGMSYFTDVRDWLGGWPMEYSHDDDVIDLFKTEFGFELVKLTQGEACSEFLFRAPAATADSA